MKPRRFILCFDKHRENGNVACVRVGGKWHVRRSIECDVPIQSVYRPKSRQPIFYFQGHGVVTLTRDTIHIGFRKCAR